MKIYIFGAKSVAIGVCRAIRKLGPDKEILGFLVTSHENNPKELDGLPVLELGKVSAALREEEKRTICVYIAVPEILHKPIIDNLGKHGFTCYRPVDSRMEADLMEQYFAAIGGYPSLHSLPLGGEKAKIDLYSAQFYRDKKLENPPDFPDYIRSIMLGCDGNTDQGFNKKADFYDNTGEGISWKNPDYCEMTAFYWVWKNRLSLAKDYVGICHYRRRLDITEEDQRRLTQDSVDVILPFPMIHLPDIREHHGRYMKEEEWQTMLEAMEELHPKYRSVYEEIFSDVCLYNYNLLVGKKKIFADYCAWVFPLLFRTEELFELKGIQRTSRSLAYMSESLLTLYFKYHRELKVYHTGRLLFI